MRPTGDSAAAHLASLDGRAAFVTGAARGLGEAMARALHDSGARVALTDVSPDVAETARDIDPDPANARGIELDVRKRGEFEAAFARAADSFGGIDIIVNNAALTPMRSVFEIDKEEWDDVMAVNLRSVFFGCQIAGAHMRERGWGRIINISSLAGQQASLIAGAHYAASKAGIISLTRSFAAALAGDGVTVNAIAPAAIMGPMMESVPEERINELARSIPVGRVGRPEEVGAACVYLASEAAAYVTGTTLDVNGGRLMR